MSPHTVVVFGASGDLTRRKLVPALYNLFAKDRLAPGTRIVGFARRPWDDDSFRAHLEEGLREFVGDDFNAENQHCAAIFHMSSSNGVRSGVGECYVQPALERPNFSLQTGAMVHRVVLQDGRAIGVEYDQSDGVHLARARREVIISAGAVGSPQVLMLSGIGPADHRSRRRRLLQLRRPRGQGAAYRGPCAAPLLSARPAVPGRVHG